MRFLRDRHPNLVPFYERLYVGKYAPTGYQKRVSRMVAEHKERLCVRQARYIQPTRAAEQLALF